MKRKVIKVIELFLIMIIVFVCISSMFESKILDNKLYFILYLIAPFILLFIIELIKIIRDLRIKEVKNNLDLENLMTEEEQEKINEVIENIIDEHLDEIVADEKEQEKTIQIPLKEIQDEIEKLNKKLSQDDNDLDKTEVLFSTDDIKEIIKKELKSTTPVDKNKKTNKKSTKTVEKSKK